MLANELVKPERTNRRTMDIRDRHRRWGHGICATSLDFIEYDRFGNIVGLMYYVNINNRPNISAPAKIHGKLAQRASLPYYIVYYDTNPFRVVEVIAKNGRAVSQLYTYLTARGETGIRSEESLVRFQMFIRGMYSYYLTDEQIRQEIG
jgi:hypothetical protein